MSNVQKENITQNKEYHNTFLLLRKYRDVVWSLEVSTKKMKSKFIKEMGCGIEEYLNMAHLAGFEFSESGVEEHTKIIEQSTYMLKLLEKAIDILRKKHKYGETYYWILYYSFLSPNQCRNTNDIINKILTCVDTISYKSYFRKRKEAIEALSTILWGYSAKESRDILRFFCPEEHSV